jgi:hypothetical protein
MCGRRVRVFCVRCGVKIGEEEVSDSFRGNALFTLCSKCRGKTSKSSNKRIISDCCGEVFEPCF